MNARNILATLLLMEAGFYWSSKPYDTDDTWSAFILFFFYDLCWKEKRDRTYGAMLRPVSY